MKATLVGVAVGVLWVGSALAPAPLAAAASAYQVAKWEAGPAALPGAVIDFTKPCWKCVRVLREHAICVISLKERRTRGTVNRSW